MNLKEILERKKLIASQTNIQNIEDIQNTQEKEVEKITKEEALEGLKVFIILYYNFYSKTKRIGYGTDFKDLLSYLTHDYIFNEGDFPPLPYGISIQDHFMFQMVYKIPSNLVYHIIQKI